MSKKEIFLIAGEQSGDLHGSQLIRELKSVLPSYTFSGVGGIEMRSEGLEAVAKTEDFEFMGFVEIALNCFTIYSQFKTVEHAILTRDPAAVVMIDYPGFNLKMAKSLRKKGYRGKLVQYISPTFWAWGKNRVKVMEETLDLLLTIYPFENKLLEGTSLNTHYVGNPILDLITQHRYHTEWIHLLGIKRTDALIAVFPGSRKSEVMQNFPDLLKAAFLLKTENPSFQFAFSCANIEVMTMIHKLLQHSPLELNKDLFLVPKSYRYELMRDCHTAIAKCGSVTLELALHERPTVVVYKTSWMNRFIAKNVIQLKLDSFSIPNILLQKQIFPELIKVPYTPETVVNHVKRMNQDGVERTLCLEDCKRLQHLLSGSRACEASAKAIEELVVSS